MCGKNGTLQIARVLIDTDRRSIIPSGNVDVLSEERAVLLLQGKENFAKEWRKIFLIGRKENIVRNNQKLVFLHDHGLPKILLVTKSTHGKISLAQIANDNLEYYFVNNTKHFFGLSLEFILKIGCSYLEDYNLYSVCCDIITMYRDTGITLKNYVTDLNELHFCWSIGSVSGKKTIQNLLYIFGKLIEKFFVEKCEEKFFCG